PVVRTPRTIQNEYLGGRESNSVSRPGRPIAIVPSGEIHPGGNRQATRAQGSSPSRLRGQARQHRVLRETIRNSAMSTQTEVIINVSNGEKPSGGKSTPPR